jgi:hypothetical protein
LAREDPKEALATSVAVNHDGRHCRAFSDPNPNCQRPVKSGRSIGICFVVTGVLESIALLGLVLLGLALPPSNPIQEPRPPRSSRALFGLLAGKRPQFVVGRSAVSRPYSALSTAPHALPQHFLHGRRGEEGAFGRIAMRVHTTIVTTITTATFYTAFTSVDGVVEDERVRR